MSRTPSKGTSLKLLTGNPTMVRRTIRNVHKIVARIVLEEDSIRCDNLEGLVLPSEPASANGIETKVACCSKNPITKSTGWACAAVTVLTIRCRSCCSFLRVGRLHFVVPEHLIEQVLHCSLQRGPLLNYQGHSTDFTTVNDAIAQNIHADSHLK